MQRTADTSAIQLLWNMVGASSGLTREHVFLLRVIMHNVPAGSTPSSSAAKHRSSSVDPRWRSDFFFLGMFCSLSWMATILDIGTCLIKQYSFDSLAY